jgi:hypothetical protein
MIKQHASIGQVILGMLNLSFTKIRKRRLLLFSSVVAVGSADMTTQVFSVPLLDKLHRFTLAGHGREIVGAFFEQDSLNVCLSLSC